MVAGTKPATTLPPNSYRDVNHPLARISASSPVEFRVDLKDDSVVAGLVPASSPWYGNFSSIRR